MERGIHIANDANQSAIHVCTSSYDYFIISILFDSPYKRYFTFQAWLLITILTILIFHVIRLQFILGINVLYWPHLSLPAAVLKVKHIIICKTPKHINICFFRMFLLCALIMKTSLIGWSALNEL